MSNSNWYVTLNERRQTATVNLYDEGTDDEVETTVPVRMEICQTCAGRGSHVNPSIDCDGLAREDFDSDPDFAEDYMGGMYDVPCYECNGRRVVPAIDEDQCDPDTLQRVREKQQRDAAYRQESADQRRYGY